MVDSPLDSLYYMIKSVFTPAMRDGTNKVAASLNDLEQILRGAAKKSRPTSSSIGNIFHPKDELMYWTEVSKSSSSTPRDAERAAYFVELLDPVKKDLTGLEK